MSVLRPPLFALLFAATAAAGPDLNGRPAERWVADLASPSARVRRDAAQALRTAPTLPEAAIPALAKALKDDDALVRQAAVAALAKAGPAASPAAADLVGLLPGEDGNVVRVLVGIGKPAVPALTRVLDGGTPKAQQAALQALGAIGPDAAAALPALRAVLADPKAKEESGRERLKAAALALGQFGPAGKEAVPDLIGAVTGWDNYSGENPAAIEALGALGPVAKDAVPVLIEELQRPGGKYHRRRVVAAWALGRIGDPAALTPLIRMLDRDDNEEQAAAAAALGGFGPAAADAVPVLTSIVRGFGDIRAIFDKGTRERAIEALGAIGRPAVPGLVELLRDPNKDSRRNAALTLARIGPAAAEAVPDLLKMLADKDFDGTAQSAAAALARIGGPAVPGLIEIARDREAAGRGWAMVALGGVGPAAKDAVPVLTAVLAEKDSWVKADAVTALGRIGSAAESALPQLVAQLHLVDAGLSMRVEAALVRIGRPAIPHLLAAIAEDGGLFHQEPACRVLAKLVGPDDDRLVYPLMRMLRYDHPNVRSNAARALTAIGPKAAAARGLLRRQMADTNPILACAAARALIAVAPEDRADAVKVLTKTLQNGYDQDARRFAVRLLGSAAGPDEIALIREAARKDGHGFVRVQAALALIEAAPAEAGQVTDALVEGLSYPDAFDRTALIRAAGRAGPPAAAAVPALVRARDEAAQYGYRFLEFQNTYSDETRAAADEALARIDPDGRLRRLPAK